MQFDDIFTDDGTGRHYSFEYEDTDETNYVIFCSIDICGIPSYIDEDEAEKLYDNPKQAEPIGTITGFLILSDEMQNRDIDILDKCDEADGDLEYAVSALMENDGPFLNLEVFNHFYIHEITLNDRYDTPEMFERVIEELPDIVFTHYHVCPDMLIYMPARRPYNDPLDEIEREIATEVHRDNIERFLGIKPKSEPHLILSPKQQAMALGRRYKGETYPESAKDKALWEKYESVGFEEWKNTRVMYKIIDE